MLELNGPVEHSIWWWIVLGLLTLAFIGWLCAIPYLTKRKLARQFPEITAPHRTPKTLRQTYVERIETLRVSFATEAINERQLHLQLSELVREYVAITTATPAQTMTYTDLQENKRTQPVADLIAQCYHPAFSPTGTLKGWNPIADPTPITIHNALLVVNSL